MLLRIIDKLVDVDEKNDPWLLRGGDEAVQRRKEIKNMRIFVGFVLAYLFVPSLLVFLCLFLRWLGAW